MLPNSNNYSYWGNICAVSEWLMMTSMSFENLTDFLVSVLFLVYKVFKREFLFLFRITGLFYYFNVFVSFSLKSWFNSFISRLFKVFMKVLVIICYSWDWMGFSDHLIFLLFYPVWSVSFVYVVAISKSFSFYFCKPFSKSTRSFKKAALISKFYLLQLMYYKVLNKSHLNLYIKYNKTNVIEREWPRSETTKMPCPYSRLYLIYSKMG